MNRNESECVGYLHITEDGAIIAKNCTIPPGAMIGTKVASGAAIASGDGARAFASFRKREYKPDVETRGETSSEQPLTKKKKKKLVGVEIRKRKCKTDVGMNEEEEEEEVPKKEKKRVEVYDLTEDETTLSLSNTSTSSPSPRKRARKQEHPKKFQKQKAKRNGDDDDDASKAEEGKGNNSDSKPKRSELVKPPKPSIMDVAGKYYCEGCVKIFRSKHCLLEHKKSGCVPRMEFTHFSSSINHDDDGGDDDDDDKTTREEKTCPTRPNKSTLDDDDEAGRYFCRGCLKTYCSKHYLVNHRGGTCFPQRYHTCPECLKCFSTEWHLIKHKNKRIKCGTSNSRASSI